MTPAPTSSLPRLVLCEFGKTDIPGLESYSPFCMKVHRGLKVLGLPYESRSGMPGSFKKHYPTGQVPVLLIGENEAVGDSTDILARLQTLVGRTFHGTSDARLAAEAALWEEFSDTSLVGFLMAARFADERNWPGVRERVMGVVPKPLRPLLGAYFRKNALRVLVARDVWRAGPDACWRRFQSVLDSLEARAPEEGFWLGTFSLADVGLFGQLFSLRQDLTPWQSEQISARPRLSRYLDRVDAATRGA
jgi:glutathione S-transferase